MPLMKVFLDEELDAGDADRVDVFVASGLAKSCHSERDQERGVQQISTENLLTMFWKWIANTSYLGV